MRNFFLVLGYLVLAATLLVVSQVIALVIVVAAGW